MELQIIKTEGYVKGETCVKGEPCKQEPVFTINNGTLVKCTLDGQKTVIIPEGIKTVGRKCFAEADVEEIVLPEGIEIIDTDAFAFCKIAIPQR